MGQATDSHMCGYSIAVAVCIWTVGTTDVLSLNVSRGRVLRGDSGRLDTPAAGRPDQQRPPQFALRRKVEACG